MKPSTDQLVIDGESDSAICESFGGGKAVRLAELRDAGYNVPPFYCVTTVAFWQAIAAADSEPFAALVARLSGAIDDAQATEAAEQIRQSIAELPIPWDVEQAVRRAHAAHSPKDNTSLAVRSSIAGEDGDRHSFAGMHDTILDVRGIDAGLVAIRRVWASAWSERAIAYRRQRHLSLDRIAPAVIVQQMVPAHAAGVLFTCDPTTGNTSVVVVSAVFGSGEPLVSGQCPGETYVIDKSRGRVSPRREAQQLTEACILKPSNQEVLTPVQLKLLTDTAIAIERLFGRPQDIEFCFDSAGQLHILQARDVVDPIEYGPAAGNHLVWDNSNIIESYSGVTTPMTFSFIRRAYTIVYHCFAEVMGIPPSVTQAHRDAFENMLGLFRGRVYYNLKNWYRLVQLFPGYRYNRRFMETMMGLNDPLVVDESTDPPSLLLRWFVDLPALLWLVARIVWKFARIETIVSRFQNHFQRHFDEWSRIDFRRLKPHEIQQRYQRMEAIMLWNWQAPIITDFYVMVFYGTLKKLCESWCGDATGTLQNGLVCGEQNVESTEPAKMLLALTAMVRADPALREVIARGPEQDLPRLIATDGQFKTFAAEVARYLDRYGLRCVHELKLEAESFRDHPHLLYRWIRESLGAADTAVFDLEALATRQQQVRSEAESQAWQALAKSSSWWPRRWIFTRVLRNARRGIRHRENMRFNRTRIYGILREMLRAIGEQFASDGILDDPADVFYLTLDEVWDFVKGTAVTTDLRGLSRLRRAEYELYRDDAEPPARRFDTYGLAYHRNTFRRHSTNVQAANEVTLTGIGCSPGVVVGDVAVMQDPVAANRPRGTILVAERTDPGWVPIFPGFAGILIERGSLLSHSAIVAREMGIPTIVGVTGLTARLQTGQRVRMDGRAGTITLECGDASPPSIP